MKTVLNLKSKGKKPDIQRKKNEKKNSSKSNFSYGIKYDHRHGNKECI